MLGRCGGSGLFSGSIIGNLSLRQAPSNIPLASLYSFDEAIHTLSIMRRVRQSIKTTNYFSGR